MPPSYDEPLPQCMGPKLHPFNGRVADIKFVRLLSSNVEESSNIEDSSNGSRGQSHVFEVTIASQPYALKVVKSAFSSAASCVLTPSYNFSSSFTT